MADPRPGATKAAPTRTARPAPPAPAAQPPARPAAPPPPAPAQPSLGELVASASESMSVLVRSEIELAKMELKVEAKKAAIGAGALGAAAFLGLFAMLLLSFAAAYGINSTGLAKGWSFLIVGGTYLLLAGVCVALGGGSLKKLAPPRRTLKTSKETVASLKETAASAVATLKDPPSRDPEPAKEPAV
jgi:hypothetical protein